MPKDRIPQKRCDNCNRFIPFEHGPNWSEWWAGGVCEWGTGCRPYPDASAPTCADGAVPDGTHW